jgi:hypothetical protein
MQVTNRKLARSRIKTAQKDNRLAGICALMVSLILSWAISSSFSLPEEEMISPVVFTFVAQAATIEPTPTPEPVITPEPEVVKPSNEIEEYIYAVFGQEDGVQALRVLKGDGIGYQLGGKIYCKTGENPTLNPLATNQNNNGSVDRGIFQINSIHGRGELDYDYKENVKFAHKLYTQSGNSFKPWTCGKLVGHQTYLD